MPKIESISLSRLQNNEHFQFMTDLDALFVKYNVEMLGINNLYPDFQTALAKEDACMKTELGSLKSKSLSEIDCLRDQTWSAIRGRVDATLSSPFEVERESARALMRLIVLYGNVRKMTYNSESAALSNLVSDMQRVVNAGYLMSVGVGPWVEELGKQNEAFVQLMNDRNAEYSERGSGDMRNVRVLIDPIVEQIIERINASLVLDIAAAEVTPFTLELNEKIKYYEKIVQARSGKNQQNEMASEES
ncbi:DUF6261 family protein [Mangrovibacterium lignilyticum]|uniref:DUF6261 family protein n=1 Tax=Mangrovibacterium lignilyticum TaxID=2668052 RepID=UPI0013D67D2E|nr:DUF6261 family protein [Mangrovibacterium lignilyticum]